MDVFKESIAQRDKFRSAANKLLNHCFVLKKKEDTRNDYIFILQHREMFEEYFDLLGYELRINENSDVAGLVNYNGTGRYRLRKIETILLLILRLLYIEKKRELSTNDNIMVFSEDIHEKYQMLKIESKPNIDKTTFRDSIRLFKRFNIISNVDTDVTQSDSRIIIYPSVLFAVPGENINNMIEEISDRLNKYAGGGVDDEETDQDQAD
ncbi:DUF4194 domain-containing protein [Gudongella sp. DL1XJH-153]|uniref:DUF4194 domain-containing protein n=1 Tax=Gudongella sp. DL1XJH-153 TaxID=3409804 RepID=UPI003BB69C1E